jgi:hypothetical protein
MVVFLNWNLWVSWNKCFMVVKVMTVFKFINVGNPKHMLLGHKSNENVQKSIIVCNSKQMFPSHQNNDNGILRCVTSSC